MESRRAQVSSAAADASVRAARRQLYRLPRAQYSVTIAGGSWHRPMNCGGRGDGMLGKELVQQDSTQPQSGVHAYNSKGRQQQQQQQRRRQQATELGTTQTAWPVTAARMHCKAQPNLPWHPPSPERRLDGAFVSLRRLPHEVHASAHQAAPAHRCVRSGLQGAAGSEEQALQHAHHAAAHLP